MRLKKLFFALVGLIVVLAVAVVILVQTLDFSEFRTLIAEQTEAATGRKLTLGGKLRLNLLTLTPSLEASHVALANAPWGTRKEMVKIRRLKAEVNLLPLLRGVISIKRVVLIEPDVWLESNRAGVGNWVLGGAAAGKTKKAKKGKKGDNGAALPLPEVQKIWIENAKFTYRDGATKKATSATVRRLFLRAAGASSPIHVEIRGELDRTPVEIEAVLGSLKQLIEGKGALAVKLSAKIGASDVSGTAKLRLRAVPIGVSANLSSKKLDLRDLTGGGRGGRMFGKAPLPLTLLRNLNVNATYMAATIILAGSEIRKLRAKLSIKGGTMTLAPLTADMAGGRLDIDLRLASSGRGARLTARIVLRNASLGQLTRQVSGKEMATGPLNIDANLFGGGNSVQAIMSSLGGRSMVTVGRGRVHNDSLKLLSASLIKAITPWAPGDRAIVLNCVVNRLDIKGGIANAKVLVGDTSRATVVGKGTIDLGRERVDLLLVPSTKQTSVASVAALLPIRVQGPLAKPSVFPDAGEAAVAAAKSLVGVIEIPLDIVSSIFGGRRKKSGEPCAVARAMASGRPAPSPSGGSATKRQKSGGVGGVLKGIGEGIGGIFK